MLRFFSADSNYVFCVLHLNNRECFVIYCPKSLLYYHLSSTTHLVMYYSSEKNNQLVFKIHYLFSTA